MAMIAITPNHMKKARTVLKALCEAWKAITPVIEDLGKFEDLKNMAMIAITPNHMKKARTVLEALCEAWKTITPVIEDLGKFEDLKNMAMIAITPNHMKKAKTVLKALCEAWKTITPMIESPGKFENIKNMAMIAITLNHIRVADIDEKLHGFLAELWIGRDRTQAADTTGRSTQLECLPTQQAAGIMNTPGDEATQTQVSRKQVLTGGVGTRQVAIVVAIVALAVTARK
ncbi:hypothetical protein AYL99_11686 [Fonsecaea erecta]|uniref:Uncharacterized protein n=1 Tax=Fonsecaea erecta TaxID=1367422 RepID=A0A178Z3M8_9EURO|nr:hypothetical protein AYL99_11686 [Fonsecaea erecta]OAP54151.1 hypothetical protein AYL99_11686 [Fonsecaea erecta]